MTYKGNYDSYVLEAQPMKTGGEGAIYKIQNYGDMVAKIYHTDKITTELEEKIMFMASNPPSQKIMDQIAWPQDVLRDDKGSFVGFVMSKLSIDTDLKAIYSYPPNPKIPISCEHKVIIAMNICTVISEIHRMGYVFGDFNPLNIGVNLTTGHVAFLDTDSYHIANPKTGKLYRCGVCLDGYVAPELIQQVKGKDYLTAPLPTFTQETDRFALAIHIFKLLMNGYTPFNGIKETESVSQASPGVGNFAIERDNYCFKPGNKPQSVATPDLSCFTPDIQYLFKQTFLGGSVNPKSRASAEDWLSALKEYKDSLTQCSVDPKHYYYVNNNVCPYCEADKRYQKSMSGTTKASSSQASFTNPVGAQYSATTGSNTTFTSPSMNVGKRTNTRKIGRILLWVFFLPIMLIITICKSRMPALAKAGLTILCLYVTLTVGVPVGMMGVATVLDVVAGISGGSSTIISAPDIEIDAAQLIQPMITGYDNYGYFDGNVKTEGSFTDKNGTKYTFSLKKHSRNEDDDITFFQSIIYKEDGALGEAYLAVKCDKYLSNDNVLNVYVHKNVAGDQDIVLTNNVIVVNTLCEDDFVRNDPKERFVPVFVRKYDYDDWYKLTLSDTEYIVCDKTIKLEIIEDKRPGAEEVHPGFSFEVYDADGVLLAQGEYLMYGVIYDANNDDYSRRNYWDDLYLKASFEQAELLAKTGILFLDEPLDLDWD